jgi:hypothetical protein
MNCLFKLVCHALLINLIIAPPLLAQKHDYIWMTGYNSDLAVDGYEINKLDFNYDPVNVTADATSGSIYVSGATIADTTGQLLFYTDGCSVFNALHEQVENGDNLNPGEVHDSQCGNPVADLGYIAGRQSSLFLPDPSSDSLYYLFHKKVEHRTEPEFDVVTVGLYYTLIDASANGGEGKVLEKNVPVLEDELTYGQLVATKHANGRDWWILTPGNTSNLYYSIQLAPEGIDTIIVSEHDYVFFDGGQANFSPDGKYYARYNALDGVLLFQFDRDKGVLDSEMFFEVSNESLSDGLAFSPNSELLYVSAFDTILQYDLNSINVSDSKEVVAVYDGNVGLFPTTFFTAQLAPDCKIYINTFANVKTLHVIHNPNERGSACGVEQHVVDLPYWHSKALPYFPNYRLGPLVEGEPAEPPCEGEFVVADEEVPLPEGKAFAVFPNPASHVFTVALDNPLSEEAVFSLYNMAGVQVQSARLEPGRQAVQMEVGGLPPGLYIGVLRTVAGRLLGRGKVVVNRKM